MAKMWPIPEGVRAEPYEDAEGWEGGDDGKCGGCNWEVDNVYLLADTLAEATEIFRENHRGLCGDCMCEMIVEGGREVTTPS